MYVQNELNCQPVGPLSGRSNGTAQRVISTSHFALNVDQNCSSFSSPDTPGQFYQSAWEHEA